MRASQRGRALLAAGTVAVLFLAGLGVIAIRSVQHHSDRLLERVEIDAAQRGGWQVLAAVAPDDVRESLAQPEPRLALSRQLNLWRAGIAFDLIVYDDRGEALASAPPELIEDARQSTGPRLDIVLADGRPGATLSAVPVDVGTSDTSAAAGDPGLLDPPLVAFLAAITLAVLALLAFLVRTTNRLERAEALRREMVADAGHELRTPLTNLRCQLEAAQDGITPAAPDLVRSLHDETMLLIRLVDDLRDLAAAEAGELGLRRAPTDVAEVARRTAHAMQASFQASGVALEIDVAPDLPPLDADADRLGQVLRNLLDNARRHTPPGGRVRLSARGDDHVLEMKVADTGTGLDPDALSHVFERGARGSGLGLAIVRSLVAAHDGTIHVDNAPDAGACFTIRWPWPASGPVESPRGHA